MAQHQVVLDAARAAGVALLAYTSAPGTLTAALADDHKGTEKAILESGVPYALLRNGWYNENYTENLAPVLEYGAVTQAAGDGRVASAARADYAAAAVAVLTGAWRREQDVRAERRHRVGLSPSTPPWWPSGPARRSSTTPSPSRRSPTS